jgi:phenylacetate-CoA ligase
VDDVLTTPDGRLVGRLDPVFKGRRAIREAQIVQEVSHLVTVKIVRGAGYEAEDGLSVEKELRARLGPEMEIRIELVESIPRTSSGKFLAVVNRAKGGAVPGEQESAGPSD